MKKLIKKYFSRFSVSQNSSLSLRRGGGEVALYVSKNPSPQPSPTGRGSLCGLLLNGFIITLVLLSNIAKAADRDPFLPYTWSAPTGADGAGASGAKMPSTNPLIDKPISAYKVIGVVVSPTDALAVLKARDKHEYFAYIGDPIGSEGGVIETINTDGITIDVAGKIVPLKVSNRFENQDEKQDEKK